MQASFINTVAQPLWEALAELLPALAPAAARISANASIYQALTQLPPMRIVQVSSFTPPSTQHRRPQLARPLQTWPLSCSW